MELYRSYDWITALLFYLGLAGLVVLVDWAFWGRNGNGDSRGRGGRP